MMKMKLLMLARYVVLTILVSTFSSFLIAQEELPNPKDFGNVMDEVNHSHEGGDLTDGKSNFQNLVEVPVTFDNSFEAARFVENKGQWNENVLYRVELVDGFIYFEKDGIKYHFYDGNALHEAIHHTDHNVAIGNHVFNLNFKDANSNLTVNGSKTFKQHNQSYFYGNKQVNGVKFFQEIKYSEIYDSIDLVYHSFNDHLKYDFNVKVGGNPNNIVYNYEGADKVYIHENGSLVVETSLGGVVEYKPFSYQIIDGEKVEVKSNFVVNGNEVSFQFPNGYDNTKELIIDPSLVASTYTGSTSDNWGNTAAHFNDGRIVIAGIVGGNGYPTTAGAFDTTFGGGSSSGTGTIASDISISVFSADGTTLLASSYLGGSDDDYPHSLVVDKGTDEIFLMGKTRSNNFPMNGTPYDATHNGGGNDIFVAKMSDDLTSLIASTFVGGSNDDGSNVDNNHDDSGSILKFNYSDSHRGQIKLDNSGNVVVSSQSRSNNFPTTGGAYQTAYAGSQDAVLFKLTSNLSTLSFSTYYGGTNFDGGFGLAFDAAGNIFMTGATRSNNIPTTAGVLDQTYNGNIDGYVAKFNSTGTTLIASTYLGTGDKDGGFYVDVDINDDVFVFGLSFGGNYPVSSGVYSNANSTQFIHGISNDLTTTNFSSVYGSGGTGGLGGRSNISPTGFEVDSCSNIIAVGWGNFVGSGTTGMPTTAGAYQTSTDGIDFHLAVFDPGMTGLKYGSFFGENGGVGDHVDGGTSTFDSKGVIYQAVCASCGGTNGFPTTAGAYSSTNNASNCNNAVFKFDLDVYAPGSAAISAAASGCAYISVPFTNNSTNAVSYLWNFGDGQTSTAFEPNHIYASPGTYTVTLIAYNPTTCITSDTSTTTITIDQPTVTVTTNPVSGVICNGSNVSFTGSGAVSYDWNPGAFTGNPYVDAPTSTTTYTVVGTDANGCTDTATVTITVDQLPTTSNAGTTQTVCQTPGTATLNGNVPTTGTGTWTLISGTGTIVSPNSPSSNVTGLGVGANVFEWTISNGACSSSSSQVTINVDADATVANAGPDALACESAPNVTLSGNTPTVGTGTWTVVSGSGTVTNINDPNSTATGLSNGSNVFVWTITNGTCSASTDTVEITVNTVPTTSNANTDQYIYVNNGTLAGNSPTSGSGMWTQISGPNTATIADPTNPNSAITGLVEGTYVFEWTISNPPCSSSSDQVTITVDLTNDPPSQGNESMTVAEDDPTTTSSDLTANNIDPDGTTTTVTTVVSTTGGGTTTISGGGTTIDYTPAPNFTGVDTVIYTVCDNGTPLPAECVNDTLFVTVTPVNDPPAQGNETLSGVTEDQGTPTTSTDLTANNTDPDGTTVTVTTVVSTTGGGATSITGGGTTIDYTPAPNFTGVDTVIYTVCDNGTPLPAECVNDTLFVTVDPVNDAPSQGNESMTVAEDDPTTTSSDLTANNIDPDGTTTTVTTIVSTTGGGTTTISGGGTTIDYTPAPNFTGVDTVIYTVCDNGTPLPAECVNDTLFVTVTPVNDPPAQGNETLSGVTEDQGSPTTSTDLTANNTDPDGTTVTVTTVVSTTGGGTTSITGGGTTIDYTPAPNFTGVDTVIYTVCDNGTPLPAECVNDTLFVTVNPVNDAPSQGNESMTVAEDDPTTTSSDLTANNIDPDGTTTTVTTVVSTTGGGTTTISGGGTTIDYTPASNFTGVDTVIYTVCDNGTPLPAECVNDTLFVTVTPVNDPPAQGNETLSGVTEDQGSPTTSSDLTTNNTDPDGTTVTVTTVVSTTGGGTTSITGGGTTIDYTPAPNFTGVDTVIYTVCDNGTPLPAECVNDTLFVTVDPVNDAPSQGNESMTVAEDDPTTTSSDLTANNTDPDGTTVTVTAVVSTTGGGTTSITGGGTTIDFTPAPNFTGVDTVIYTVCDNGTPLPAECVNDTLFVTVTPVNDPPIVDNEFISVPQNGSNTGDLTDLGDSDVDGNLVVNTTPTGGPSHGVIVINPDGTFLYTPTIGYTGPDTVIVEICDDGTPLPAICVNDTIFITVIPTLPPIADDNSASTDEEVPVTFNVTSTDVDPDGTIDNSTVDLDPSSPGIQNTFTDVNGNVWTVDANGDVTFTPAPDYNGTATISYTVNDNDGATSNTATLTVTVNPISDAPSQGNESMTVSEDDPTTASPSLVANNTDPDGTATTVTTIVSTTGGGTTTISGGGTTIDYTPAADFNGIDTVIYTVCDNGLPTVDCVNDTLFVTVTPVNDPPVQGNETLAGVTEDQGTPTTSTDLTANNTDPDGTTVTVTTVVSTTGGGTTSITGGGTTIDYTPAPNFTGVDTVIYTVCDNGTPLPAECVNDTLFVTVDPVNDAPSQGNESMTVAEDDPTTTSSDLTANNIDPDGTTTTVTTVVSTTGGGTTAISGGGTTIDYTPASNFTGVDTVIYTVCDNGTPLPAECVNDTLFVTVTPVNDPPAQGNETLTGIQLNETNPTTTVDLTANNTDPDGTTVTVTTIVSSTGGGTVVNNGNNTFDYTPAPGFTGTDTVIYTVCDNGTPLPAECVNDTLFVIVTDCLITDLAADCDGDGVSNGDEQTPPGGGTPTDPNDPCDYNVADQNVSNVSTTWLNADCDGDGVSNGDELTPPDGETPTDPNNPCDYVFADLTLPIVSGNDCDGDGVTDSLEVENGTLPNDACDYNLADITLPIVSGNDCDGDGVTDSLEVENGTLPNDACDYNLADITLPIVSGNDCDGDGVTDSLEIENGTLPNDACDYNLADITLPIVSGNDCDGDGVTDSLEVENGTLPNDACDYNLADITLPIVSGNDCDGDGVTDSLEIENGTLPNDPCDYNLADITLPIVSGNDCDGDGVTDSLEVENGTLPNDPCDYNVADITLPQSGIWLTVDCDGDGVSNGDEMTPPNGDAPTDPNDPCDYNVADQNTASADAAWLAADCDGDGVSNGDEVADGTNPLNNCDFVAGSITLPVTTLPDCDGDGVSNDDELNPPNGDAPTDPNDPCDYNVADQDINAVNSDWNNLDCDTDGVLNGVEINPTTPGDNPTDPTDPCDYNLTDQVIGNVGLAWNAEDCDGDGVSNGDEVTSPNGGVSTNPNDPCDYNLADITLPIVSGNDCDGDGVSDSLEIVNGTLPNDPCDYNVADVTMPIISGNDCDGDGVTDSLEIANGTLPNDPCDYNMSDITLPIVSGNDCDGDGVTDSLEIANGTLPNDPCDYNTADITLPQTGDWLLADCDGDGVTNGDELNPPNGDNPTDPNDPCDTNLDDSTQPQSGAWNALDCDGDGVTNGDELNPPNGDNPTDPNDPCDNNVVDETLAQGGEWNTSDCDGDGVTNGQEVIDGTDPYDACELVESNITEEVTVFCDLIIPDAFSPDGDGHNDYFVIKGIEAYPTATILIMNRWGNKVYESTGGYPNDWDGKSQFGVKVGGDELPEGTYFYILDLGDGSEVIKGFIYLKR